MNTRRKKIEAIAIAAIMMFSVFAGIIPAIPFTAIPLATAYQSGGNVSDVNNSGTSVGLNDTYSLVGADAYNVTYENALVNLNFTIHLNAPLYTNYTNLTLDFFDIGATLPEINHDFMPEERFGVGGGHTGHNISNISSSTENGWAMENGSATIRVLSDSTWANKTISIFNATGGPINSVGEGNAQFNNNNTNLYFTVWNVTMPAVSADSNRIINVTAWNKTGSFGLNGTDVYITVKDDEVKPTISTINIPAVGQGDQIRWVNTTAGDYIARPAFQVWLNDTLSGIKNSSIVVKMDGTEMINGSKNQNLNLTEERTALGMAGDNVTRCNNRNVSVGEFTYHDYAANLTAGTTHTITVTVSDNSTNAATTATTTFTLPRIILNATNLQVHADTLNIVANGSDPVNISALVLKPCGEKDNGESVTFSSTPTISFDGSNVRLTNLTGVAIINATFTTAGTYVIKAIANSTVNTINVNVVKDIAGVKLEVNTTEINATETDAALFTATAIATDGTEVPRSGYEINILGLNRTSGGATSGTWNKTSGTTGADGKANFQLTSSTKIETVDVTATIVLKPTGTNTSTPVTTVKFVAGYPLEMDAFTSAGTPSFSDYTLAIYGNDHLNVSGLTVGTDVTLTVRVNDSSQHPITDRTVTFTRIEGLGTFAAGATSTTDSTGDATGNYTAVFTPDTTAKANSTVINVTITGNESLYQWFDLSTVNATADHVVVSAIPTGLPADDTSKSTITAKIVDVYGNNVSNYAGVANITFTTTAGTLNTTAPVNTNATGFAVVSLTSSLVAETATITATANLTTVTLPGGNSSTCDVSFGTAGKLAIGANDTLIDKDTGCSKIWVQLQTADGTNLGLQGKDITFMVIGNASINATQVAHFDNCTAQTNSTGAANAILNGSIPSYAETVTVQASSSAYPTFAPVSIDITLSGAPHHLALTNTTPTASNATGFRNSTVTVQLQDEDDNKVGAAKTVMFTLTDPGGTATLSTYIVTTNATTGNETTILYANTTTGAQTVTVTATSAGLTGKDITIEFPAKAVPGALTVTANVTSVVVNTPTPVEFNVTSDGAAVVGALVSVSQAGVELVNGTTASTGLITVSVNATSTDTVNVTATKAGCTEGNTTIPVTTGVTGDVNGDGKVNVLDMIRIGQHFGETGTSGWIPEDVKEDGVINVLDMIVIGQNWTG